jgi:hypothetical protein
MKRYILFIFYVMSFAITQAQMSPAELSQIDELNRMRTKPQEYAATLRKYAGNSFMDTTSLWILRNELIPLFDTMKPLPPLLPSFELRKAANEFNGFDSATAKMRHDTHYWRKVENNGFGQNLVNSISTVGSYPIVALMIDKCYQDRGHRVNFLNPYYTHVSVRIIRFWGSDENRFSSMVGFVFDMISKDKSPSLYQPDFKGRIGRWCFDPNPQIEVHAK